MDATSHRIFHIPELVHTIVEAAATGGRLPLRFIHTSVDAYRDVTSLGLTSKIFREAALKAVWDTQYSLIPLFRSVGLVGRLPSDICMEGRSVVKTFVRFA